MIKRLLNDSEAKLNSTIIKQNFSVALSHPSLDIFASAVYSMCKGVVLFIGLGDDDRFVVSVQVNDSQCIRYGNLLDVSLYMGQLVDTQLVGHADEYVSIEYVSTTKSTSIWPVRIGEVTYYKHNPYPVISGDTALDSPSAYNLLAYGQTMEPDEVVDPSTFSPYLANIASDCTSFDCEKMKAKGVACVMLHGGMYYDVTHMPRTSGYIYSNLKSQIAEVTKHGLPWGMIVGVRARNVAEAVIECVELKKLLKKYRPSLGVWLQLDLYSKVNAVNNSILDKYYETLQEFKLHNQCGLYCNRTTLKEIDWEIYQSKFYLWIDDRMSNLSILDNVLTPSLFAI